MTSSDTHRTATFVRGLPALVLVTLSVLAGPGDAHAASDPAPCLSAKANLEQRMALAWPEAEAAIRLFGTVASKQFVIAGYWDAIAAERQEDQGAV